MDDMKPHATTIIGVRRNGKVALGGDGQVTFGDTILKSGAVKIRRLHNDAILAGFAGATADAFALFEKFEAKIEEFSGNVSRAVVELAKWMPTTRTSYPGTATLSSLTTVSCP